jgi:acyl-CoA thioesterase I
MGKWFKVLGLLLSVCLSVPASANSILVVGDSISAAYGMAVENGWVNLLKKRLDEHYPDRYQVVNASVSGDTTAGGVQRLPALLEQHKPDKVIIELGGNDGLRGMSVKTMSRNLQQMIDMSRQKGAEVVLMSIELPPSYGWFFNQRFQKVFDELEDTNNVPRVALSFDLVDEDGMLQPDGIHPTEKAQPLLAEKVWQVLH